METVAVLTVTVAVAEATTVAEIATIAAVEAVISEEEEITTDTNKRSFKKSRKILLFFSAYFSLSTKAYQTIHYTLYLHNVLIIKDK